MYRLHGDKQLQTQAMRNFVPGHRFSMSTTVINGEIQTTQTFAFSRLGLEFI